MVQGNIPRRKSSGLCSTSLTSKFHAVAEDKLPTGIDRATKFKSVCINTAIYLPWLVSECLRRGIVFKRAIFSHISEAAGPGIHESGQRADIVVNCTGLSARSLGGVNDHNLYPVRGQTVLVRNETDTMYSISGNDHAADEMSYIMTRGAGGGTILGGCSQVDNWNPQPDLDLAVRIMKVSRDVRHLPHLRTMRWSLSTN
jgi:glycine/D-amino acid oxidase-like deaminating enzyme